MIHHSKFRKVKKHLNQGKVATINSGLLTSVCRKWWVDFKGLKICNFVLLTNQVANTGGSQFTLLQRN